MRRTMKISEAIVFAAQILLVILQFFGAFGSIYFLVYVILIFVEKDNDERHYYTEKDLIILSVIFVISLLTHVLGIIGSLGKKIYILLIFVIFLIIEIIIFFASGLLLCGSWNVIALFVALILIGLLQNQLWPNTKTKPQPVTIAGTANQSQSYSHLDNNPPDYNSIAFHKSLSPPEYHSVDLVAVLSGPPLKPVLEKY